MICPVAVANEMSGLKGRVEVASYPQRLKVDAVISGPSFGAGHENQRSDQPAMSGERVLASIPCDFEERHRYFDRLGFRTSTILRQAVLVSSISPLGINSLLQFGGRGY